MFRYSYILFMSAWKNMRPPVLIVQVLRQPRQFLTELLERTLAEMRSATPDGELIETLATALIALLQHQPALADLVGDSATSLL